ncbi:conserved hypothetical protein [Cyanophage PSS2]|nr:conserved hypothetical protein [Cyanophage PSS2]
MLKSGTTFDSPGGSFNYMVLGPVCRLYDREQLPWPSCSLIWRGKQPSWNRIGPRFVPDMATCKCPSYAVVGIDRSSKTWYSVVSDFSYRMPTSERKWWIWKGPAHLTAPMTREEMTQRLEAGATW